MLFRVFQEKATFFRLTKSLVAKNVTCEHSLYFNFPEVAPQKNLLFFLTLTRSRWKSTCSLIGFAVTDSPLAETSSLFSEELT